MSQATDAIIAWGIDLGRVEEFEDDKLAEQFLDDDFDPNDQFLPDGVSLILHCSNSSPGYLLALTATHVTAVRGKPLKIPKNLEEHANLAGQKLIDEACEILGIPKQRAAWLLASYWEV